MPLRFSRRLSIIPGLRLNLSKSGVSASIGHRGAWYTVGSRGQRATVGLPGTGLFWTERIGKEHAAQNRSGRGGSARSGNHKLPPAAPPHAGHRWAFILFLLVVAWLASRLIGL